MRASVIHLAENSRTCGNRLLTLEGFITRPRATGQMAPSIPWVGISLLEAHLSPPRRTRLMARDAGNRWRLHPGLTPFRQSPITRPARSPGLLTAQPTPMHLRMTMLQE